MRDANDDKEFMQHLQIKFHHSKGPRIFSNLHRLVGQVLFGVFYRGLIHSAIPWESSVIDWAPLIIPLGTAFGTYMVSNVGRQKSPFYLSLIGAYIGEFLVGQPHLLLAENNTLLVGAVAMCFSTFGWEWRRSKERVSCWKTLFLVMFVYAVFLGLCSSFVYFNASVETEEGETIKVRDTFENFFNSPAWQQIKTAFWILLADFYQNWQSDGFGKAWDKFVDLADIEGEDHAYDVLGLERGAEFKEVRKRYKELAREWHPDHHQGEEMKLVAQEKFAEYSNAYTILEAIHKRRKKYGEDADD